MVSFSFVLIFLQIVFFNTRSYKTFYSSKGSHLMSFEMRLSNETSYIDIKFLFKHWQIMARLIQLTEAANEGIL